MSPEVRIAGLRFQRGVRTVLDIPSLTLSAGSTTALLGPNGSGKTTLLRLIGGLERPSSGAITADEMPITPTRDARLLSAFAFQENVVLSGTVASNIELGLRVRGVRAAERPARVESAAAIAGVSHLLGRDARMLSGGEARRVSLARALVLRAPLTLLDEPLAGLDAATRAQLLDDL
ncbi:MAG TPA: ATP-binding cassette domain-containing protein, partial [Tepidiformaceae bacterium]|nr:ATP-binding cassette domain-containing protein [Tepidiformaceae bacterium]